jgi:hypothetical protein
MNVNVGALRDVALRIGWKRAAAIAGAALALLVVAKLFMVFVLKDENRAAGEEIVAAVEAYKAANQRYPETLAQLQPKYLGKLPQPASGTNFVYASSPDGKAAWFGYQTMSDAFSEYDSQSRKWQKIEYDQSQALRMRTKEFVMGPK